MHYTRIIMHSSSSSNNTTGGGTKNSLGLGLSDDGESCGGGGGRVAGVGQNNSCPWGRSLYNTFLPLFIKPGPQGEQQLTNNFKVFLLLEAYLNLCYYLFLIPFRIAKDSRGVYQVTTNVIQQILSTLLLTIITLFSLLDLRHYDKEYNLRERPDQTFQYATIFIVHWIPVCWMFVFWLRRKHFTHLLDVCQTRFIQFPGSNNERERNYGYSAAYFRILKWAWMLKVTICMMGVKNVLLIYNEILSEGSLLKYLDSQGKRFLYDIWLEKNTDIMENPEILSAIGYVAAVVRFILEFVIYMFDQWCLTAAAMSYTTCQHFLDDFRKLASSEWNDGEDPSAQRMEQRLRQISTTYLDMMAILDGFNKIYGICIVMFFMYLYPLFIWSVFDSVQNNSLIDNIIKIHDLSMLCLVTVIAAEASSKVEVFKQWLFETAMSNLPCGIGNDGSHDALLRLTTMHREVSSEAVGLKGYKFFTVTYRFVATMIGVVITYAIVMFQFVMDPRKAQIMNTSTIATTSLPGGSSVIDANTNSTFICSC